MNEQLLLKTPNCKTPLSRGFSGFSNCDRIVTYLTHSAFVFTAYLSPKDPFVLLDQRGWLLTVVGQ